MSKRKTALPKSALPSDPAAQAKSAVAHLPVDATGRVKLTLAVSLDRAAAERLSARAIAEGRNLEDVVAEILENAAPPARRDRSG